MHVHTNIPHTYVYVDTIEFTLTSKSIGHLFNIWFSSNSENEIISSRNAQSRNMALLKQPIKLTVAILLI